jgi:hypothetical protein
LWVDDKCNGFRLPMVFIAEDQGAFLNLCSRPNAPQKMRSRLNSLNGD